MNSHENGLGDIKNATAIINPVSSTSNKGQRRLKKLIAASPFPITSTKTSHFPEKTDAIIRKALEESDLVMFVGGDGTFNRGVHILASNHLSEKARQVPIWSIGGGNADDGYIAGHTEIYRRHPERVLHGGRIVDVHPIRFDVLEPGDDIEKSYWAAFYATMGMTALAASEEYLNNRRYRRHLGRFALGRLIGEPMIVTRALVKAGVNNVVQDGVERYFYEEIFANSDRMAKHFHFPTDLTSESVFHMMIEDKTIGSILPPVWQGKRGRLAGDYLKPGEAMSFDSRQDVYAQFDGESIIIPSGSGVSVSINEEPIKVVVTNPKLVNHKAK